VSASHTTPYDGGVEDVEVEIRDNPEAGRYEAHVGDRLAGYAAYQRGPATITFTHTDVPHRWEGRGIGGRLARAALDDARAQGLGAVPRCPFIAAWIRRHPEYADLVPEDERRLLDRRR
jgi:predicted GNAT family acetyltransferase